MKVHGKGGGVSRGVMLPGSPHLPPVEHVAQSGPGVQRVPGTGRGLQAAALPHLFVSVCSSTDKHTTQDNCATRQTPAPDVMCRRLSRQSEAPRSLTLSWTAASPCGPSQRWPASPRRPVRSVGSGHTHIRRGMMRWLLASTQEAPWPLTVRHSYVGRNVNPEVWERDVNPEVEGSDCIVTWWRQTKRSLKRLSVEPLNMFYCRSELGLKTPVEIIKWKHTEQYKKDDGSQQNITKVRQSREGVLTTPAPYTCLYTNKLLELLVFPSLYRYKEYKYSMDIVVGCLIYLDIKLF